MVAEPGNAVNICGCLGKSFGTRVSKAILLFLQASVSLCLWLGGPQYFARMMLHSNREGTVKERGFDDYLTATLMSDGSRGLSLALENMKVEAVLVGKDSRRENMRRTFLGVVGSHHSPFVNGQHTLALSDE